MRTSACVIAAVAAFAAWGPASAQSETGGGVPSGRVISVNFASGKNNTSYEIPAGTAYGLVSASGWNNVTGSSGTDVALSVSGASEAAAASMTFAANGTWSYDAEGTDDFLRYFLGDNTHDGVNGATINVTNIPFANYDVIVYLTTDTASVPFRPVSVNGTLYIGDDSATPWKTAATEDANATFGQSLTATPAYGTNALRVTALSGDLAIQGSVQAKENGAMSQRCNIAGFQIVEVLPTISVNFAGDASGDHSVPIPETSEAYGLFSVPGSEWKNGFGASGAIQVSSAYGSAETFSSTISYKSKNIYYDMDNDTLLKTYLDDGIDTDNDINGASISMDNVPFTEYAVIVYFATDNGSAFFPVTVNGKPYTCDSETGATEEGSANFGNPSVKTPTLGQNALCVTGLSGNLTIGGGESSSGQGVRGGIAAIQIICTGKVVGALAPSSVMSLNFASGGNGNISESTVANQTGNFGLAAVPAGTWVDLTGNENADGQTVSTLYGEEDVAGWTGATVTWGAQNSYSYKTGQVRDETEPFLKTYLDDGGSGASVNVANLPFAAYDVIVYNATDSGKAFYPVTVNSVPYTWDDTFGTIATKGTSATYGPNERDAVAGLPTATLGVNALRVDGLTASALSIQGAGTDIGGNSSMFVRAGLAAVQIVARKLITVSGEQAWANISDGLSASDPVLIVFETGATLTGDVTLPQDAIVNLTACDFSDGTPPFSGALTVNAGTALRLPEGFTSGKIAASVSGTPRDNGMRVGGVPVWLTLDGDTGTLAASYLWTDQTGNHLWSDPGNWASLIVPGTGSDVFFEPAASHPETVILDAAATVASVTVEGRGDTVSMFAIDAQGGGSLAVSGRLLATGNVTVTQSADITVNGTTETYSTGVGYPEQPCQAGFHVHGATWQIASGTLSMPTDGGANTGEAGISGGGTLIVGGEGASNATLAVRQIRPIMYGQALTSANGTLRVAAGGTLTATEAVTLAVSYGQPYTVDLAGGAIETPNLRTFTGVTVSDDSTLRAPEDGALAVAASGSNDALTGAGGVTLSGAMTIASALATYSGTLTVAEGAALTLSDSGARPALALDEGAASLTVTPSTEEAALGEIDFPTAMTAEPANVGYTVTGLAEGTAVFASVANGTLTLSWAVAYPTLAQTGSWSEAAKWTNVSAETAPAAGVAILDGTSAPITVTLNTALTEMTSIVVRGDVSLKTTGAQTTIPACVTLAEGATLGVGATSFGNPWALPAGTTLRIENAGFSLANIQTVNSYTQFAGNVEIVFSDGSIGDSAGSPIRIDGTLSITGDDVTFTNLGLLAGDVDLSGNRICLDRERGQGDGTTSSALGIGSEGTTTLTNRGDGNRIAHATRLNGTIDVQSGSLALLTEQPGDVSTTSSAYHATIAEGATLILEEGCAGGQYPATGAGTYAVGTNRPQFAAVGGATTTPAIITATATEAEQSAGTITFGNYQSAVFFPDGFEAKITPYGAAAPWVTVAQAGGNTLRILNVPPPSGGVAYSDDAELALRQAAAAAGLTGDYAVQVRTGGQTVSAPSDNLVSGILKCFTGIEPVGDAGAVTLAYDFGITDVRVSGGQVSVTVKVQGADGAAAGFAEGVGFALLNGEALLDAVSSDIGGGMATLSAALPEGDLRLTVRVSEPSEAKTAE